MIVLGSRQRMRELEAHALRALTKTQFQRFCLRLLEEEYLARFEPKTVEIESGFEDEPDGGRDLRAVVSRSAHTRAHWALLPDEPAAHESADFWYSCKTHKSDAHGRDPGGWRKQIRDDLDPSPRIINGRTGKLVDNAEDIARSEEKRSPPADLLAALHSGSGFVVLVNVEASKRLEFEAELRTLFGFWLHRKFGRVPNLQHVVRVRDASYLARVFNERPFTLSPELQARLRIDEPAHLLDWVRWTEEFERDRRDMVYREDVGRATIAKQLLESISSDQRAAVFRLWGPPGVGKTRLAHHTLEAANLQERVRFSQDFIGVLQWLTSRDGGPADDQILVVDEVPPIQAGTLAKTFGAIAPARARLIIVGPQDLGNVGGPTPVLVERLEPDTARAILIDEMNAADERIAVALALCGGYPLFAMWLGHALALDPELLRAPGSALTNDHDPWDAACAVLVGPRGADQDAWRAAAERRAKALLLASMTTERSWDGLQHDEEVRIVDALGIGWSDLMGAARECENRGLLRRPSAGNRRYVSPANLERLVLNHFFGDSGPGGPPLDPRRLARTLPEFFPTLLPRAELVIASDACKRNLSSAVFAEIHEAMGRNDGATARRLAEFLPWASHHDPSLALAQIESLFGEFGPERIVAALGRWAGESLAHLTHREIGAGEFERVEALLFELARAGFTPGELRGFAWTHLFAAVLHLTRRPFEERFAILQRRLASKDTRERALAVVALGHLVEPRSISATIEEQRDDVDGPWEHAQTPEPDYHQRFRAGWSTLLDMCEDSDETVSALARTAVAANLKNGLSIGLDDLHIDRLAAAVSNWTARQRGRLIERLDDNPDRSESLSRLRTALEPVTLDEKLLTRVGRWPSGPRLVEIDQWRERVQARDAELAREIITHAAAEHFEWLRSNEAVRAREFATALGREDRELRLLPQLQAAANDSAGRAVVAAYMAGWAEVAGDLLFDQWRAVAAIDPETLARVLARVPGTDARARQLLALLRDSKVPSDAVAGVGLAARWAASVSNPVIDELLIALDERLDEGTAREGVGLTRTRLTRTSSELSDRTRAAMHRLLGRAGRASLPSVVAVPWIESVVTLAHHGDLEPLDAALRHVARPNYVGFSHHLVEALQLLVRTGFSAQIWAVLVDLLDDEVAAGKLAPVLEDSGLLEHDRREHG